MQIEQVQFTLPDSMSAFVCVANKCTSSQTQPSPQPQDGATLVFAHCSSAHKEQWNVTIQKLFELTAGTSLIREAWALELPSHGDSAVLNQEKLRGARPISVQDYGDLLYYFSRSPYVAGHRLIAVGHSSSTTAWSLTWKHRAKPPIAAFILIEPVMVVPPVAPVDPRILAGAHNVKSVLARRNRWYDMDALAAWMRTRYPWKLWDPRVLDVYLKHGFMVVEDGPSSYVTSRIPVSHEAILYEHHDHVAAGEVVHEICAQVPVHCVFGERPEMVSLKSRALLCDASQGRRMASVSIVPKAGHLAVQENPEGVAVVIHNILNMIPRFPTSDKAKL